MSDFSVCSPGYSGLSLSTYGSSFSTNSGSSSFELGSSLLDSGSYDLGSSSLDSGSSLYDTGSSSLDSGSYDLGSNSLDSGSYDSGSDAYNVEYNPLNNIDYNPKDHGIIEWKKTDQIWSNYFWDTSNLINIDTRYGDFTFGGAMSFDNSFSLDSFSSIMNANYNNGPFGIGFGGQFDNHGFHSVSGSATYNDFSFTGTHNLDTYSTNINAGYNFTDNFSVSGSVNYFENRFRDPSILFRWRF